MGPKIGPMTHPSLTPIKDRLVRTAILAAIGLCIGALIAGFSMLRDGKATATPAILNVAGVGGPFTLTDQDGKKRTEKNFDGKYKLIYFGFASCPAICPTELQKIAAAYNGLSDAQKSKIQMIFITVDPERDTAKVLKKYVPLFDPTLIGLTGTPDQIEKVKAEFKVYAAKVGDGDDYTMDHSSFIYFMTPNDQLIALFKTQQTSDEIEDFIRKYLKKNGGQ